MQLRAGFFLNLLTFANLCSNSGNLFHVCWCISVIDFPDAPFCKPDKVQVFGVARDETVRISCSVYSDPPDGTHFEWRFNASSSAMQRGKMAFCFLLSALSRLDTGLFKEYATVCNFVMSLFTRILHTLWIALHYVVCTYVLCTQLTANPYRTLYNGLFDQALFLTERNKCAEILRVIICIF